MQCNPAMELPRESNFNPVGLNCQEHRDCFKNQGFVFSTCIDHFSIQVCRMGIYSTIVKGFIDANTVETVQIIEITSISYMWL